MDPTPTATVTNWPVPMVAAPPVPVHLSALRSSAIHRRPSAGAAAKQPSAVTTRRLSALVCLGAKRNLSL